MSERLNHAARQAAAIGLRSALVAAVTLASVAPGSVAAKGVGHVSPSSGTCSVTPNPVPIGADWTMAGTGLPRSTFVNVFESDSASTTVWMAQTSGSGTVSITWHSYNAGTDAIKITTAAVKKTSTLAACTFAVN